MEYFKTEDNKLKVTSSFYYPDGSSYSQDNIYDMMFLENQITSITQQRDEMIALKASELEAVNSLIAKCDELGITAVFINE